MGSRDLSVTPRSFYLPGRVDALYRRRASRAMRPSSQKSRSIRRSKTSRQRKDDLVNLPPHPRIDRLARHHATITAADLLHLQGRDDVKILRLQARAKPGRNRPSLALSCSLNVLLEVRGRVRPAEVDRLLP